VVGVVGGVVVVLGDGEFAGGGTGDGGGRCRLRELHVAREELD
jgi:hypothetical protein